MQYGQQNYNSLNTFKILYYIYGGLGCFFSLIFLFYAVLGGVLSSTIEHAPNRHEMPFNPGSIFIAVGLIGFLFVATATVLSFVTANNFSKHKGYSIIFATGIIVCLTGILGIVLGVFTLVEINKPHIKALLKGEHTLDSNTPLQQGDVI